VQDSTLSTNWQEPVQTQSLSVPAFICYSPFTRQVILIVEALAGFENDHKLIVRKEIVSSRKILKGVSGILRSW